MHTPVGKTSRQVDFGDKIWSSGSGLIVQRSSLIVQRNPVIFAENIP
jgi:hypothetical protein